jgi:hypothetical protein
LKNIEQVQPGDWVLSRCADTGEQGFKPVAAMFVTHPARLYHLTIRAGRGQDAGAGSLGRSSERESSEDDEGEFTLVSTGEHPFFVRQRGGFVAAEDLAVGDEFALADGSDARLVGVAVEEAPFDEAFTTYNFEVAAWHTYFAGERGVWVHNVADRACERLIAIWKKFQGPPWNLKPIAAIERTLNRVAPNAQGAKVVQALDPVTKEAFRLAREAPGTGYKELVPDYNGWKQLLAGRMGPAQLPDGRWLPGASTLHVNHGATDAIMEVFGVDLSLRNRCPAFPLCWDRHSLANARPEAFHSVLRRKASSHSTWPRDIRGLNRDQAEQLLRETYAEMKWLDGTPMDDVAEVVVRWLKEPQ